MKKSAVLVGNTSCGLYEAPQYKLPFVNILPRQSGRTICNSVINVSCNSVSINNAIDKSLHDERFKKQLKEMTNPYYKKDSEKEIVKILESAFKK